MTIFVDASAIVAMISREPEAANLAECLFIEEDRLSSPIAVWESVRAVERTRGVDFEEASRLVADFLVVADIRLVPVGAEEGLLALQAHASFGRGVHPAKLNMGDCFAYACARRHGAALLFKGDDFPQTDIADALLT